MTIIFKHRFNNKNQGCFPSPHKEGHLFVKIKKKTFEHCEDINYTLVGVSIHPVTTKIQASFLTQLPERKETVQGFQHEANVFFKQLQSLMAVIGEN